MALQVSGGQSASKIPSWGPRAPVRGSLGSYGWTGASSGNRGSKPGLPGQAFTLRRVKIGACAPCGQHHNTYIEILGNLKARQGAGRMAGLGPHTWQNRRTGPALALPSGQQAAVSPFG